MARALSVMALLALGLFVACGSRTRDRIDDSTNLPGDGGVGGQLCTEQCPLGTVCVAGRGCLPCAPGQNTCVGNDVHTCGDDGKPGALVTTCDASKGQVCSNGQCATACEAAANDPSNTGCEFWAVDLDLADGITNPASGPWALVLSNASQIPADVRVEKNDAPVGSPPSTSIVWQGTIAVGDLAQVNMPTREVDCGKMPDDHAAPGSCLSSNAFRVSSSAPIVAYQFNNIVHNYSTDASLLLPTPVLGTQYRAIGWPAADAFPTPGAFVQHAYVTIVGTQPNTTVSVRPSWRIKGNAPIAATPIGGMLTMTIGPFDVLNLESDDATISECTGPAHVKPPYCSDMTGTIVETSAPVAVFSGVESTGVGSPPDAPLPPDWGDGSGKGCCKQHLEEQLPPLTAIGKKFVVTRSPIRSTSDLGYVEPDVLRFVGAAAPAHVSTNLPPPHDSFTLQPGEIVDTWTQKDIVVTSSEPILVAQFLVAQDYVSPNPKGDPSFTIFSPVEQQKQEYVFLSPKGWKESWVVIAAEGSVAVAIDGAAPSGCITAPAGMLDGKTYEARRCPLAEGVHRLSGSGPFGIMAYGYDDADVYSFPGGAFVKKIYMPPALH